MAFEAEKKDDWKSQLIEKPETIAWKIEIIRECPEWTFPPQFLARLVPFEWPEDEVADEWYDNPQRQCLLKESEKEQYLWPFQSWYNAMVGAYPEYWGEQQDELAHVMEWTHRVRALLSDEQLILYQQEFVREVVEDGLVNSLDINMDEMTYLKEKFEHIRDVLSAMLEDEQEDYTWPGDD